MSDVQSQLSRYRSAPALTEGQVKALGARAWEEQETLVVRLSAVTDPIVQRMIRAVAAYVFGNAP